MSSFSPDSQTPSESPVQRAEQAAVRGAVERAAGWLSAACAVHCLLLPIVSAVVPLMGASSRAGALFHGIDPVLSVFLVVGGMLSAVLGYRRHGDARLSGLTLLCIAVYMAGHLWEGVWYGNMLAVAAGLGLAAASFVSARLSHTHDPECDHVH